MSLKSTSFKSDEHKSDTDSGRSSIHGEKEIIERILIAPNKLRVTRCTDDKLKTILQPKASKVDVIGVEHKRISPNSDSMKCGRSEGQLQVASRKNIILKRRNLLRRNTIELSHFNADWQLYNNSAASKTIECDDKTNVKLTGQMHLVGASMPGNKSIHSSNFRFDELSTFFLIFAFCSRLFLFFCMLRS